MKTTYALTFWSVDDTGPIANGAVGMKRETWGSVNHAPRLACLWVGPYLIYDGPQI